MLHYLIAALFIICAALASGSLLLSYQLRKRQLHPAFQTLFYLQVFVYMFGFYAIWGQVFITGLLSSLAEDSLLSKIRDILMLLASPFMVFAWYMLLRFSRETAGKKIPGLATFLFMLFNLITLLLMGLATVRYPKTEVFQWVKNFYLVSNVLYSVLSSWLLFSQKSNLLPVAIHRRMALIISGFMVVQTVFILLYTGSLWQSMAFTFLFFIGSSMIPVFLYFSTPMIQVENHNGATDFEAFCLRYEISPREKDIIREICNGHTNQEIADKLFISLQTVKDHTHRIYSKVEVKSRVQLLRLVENMAR